MVYMISHCWPMVIPDGPLLDLIKKVRSWISWGNRKSNSVLLGLKMTSNLCETCFHCERDLLHSCQKFQCQSCGRLSCKNCVQGLAFLDVVTLSRLKATTEDRFDLKSCKLCFELGPLSEGAQRCSGKVYPSESSRQSPDSPSLSLSGEKFDGHFPHVLTISHDLSFSNHPSPVSIHLSPSRSEEDEEEDSIFSASNRYFGDTSDVDSISGSARCEFYTFTSVGSSPSDSPSRINIISNRVGHYVQQDQGGTPRSQNGNFNQELAYLDRDAKNVEGLSIFQNKSEKLSESSNFETDEPDWFPPPADGVDDDAESSFFTYDDEDDEVGDLGAIFFANAGCDSMILAKEKQHVDRKETLRSVVQGYFRALVSQLLQEQGVIAKENCAENWLDLITAIAWQAATYIKPDTSRGGSMDPCDYVKVKCVASGIPSESKLIKGVVCTKNIKHKRMTSQFKNTRVLLLGGALEYQRAPNQLTSFNTLLQQENDYLRIIVSKIEALRPHVLLVEKSVSSFAQEQLLAKEISLVLNVKRSLLERIARCTGANITPTTDHLSTTRLGHCEIFYLEKISEDQEPINPFNKNPSKTLMFFEGCPRRLGCTVILRGSCREELKKVKHVVQYAVFAAHHLLLETSFLADEGASLPEMATKSTHFIQERMTLNKVISVIPDSVTNTRCREEADVPNIDAHSVDLNLDLGLQESLSDLGNAGYDDFSMTDEFKHRKSLSEACYENLSLDYMLADRRLTRPSIGKHTTTESNSQEGGQLSEAFELEAPERIDGGEASHECYPSNDHQSILVSYSSHCMLNGTLCKRSRLLRIKFYGPSDKPLGRYLRDDLFDQSFICQSCKESAESHLICYTHQHGNLTINVRRLPSVKLPGEQDGKIWMWHKCLRCTHTGVPQATRRMVMSDAAWGLSFGKFLELSFSDHTTANRVASCGHSLQRDCLRFYGFGTMVAFFRYSPINTLSVHLPPSTLEFGGPDEQIWIRKEASELLSKAESLFTEISGALHRIEQKVSSSMHEFADSRKLHNHVLELNDMLVTEKNYCKDLLQLVDEEISEQDQVAVDILEINRLRHSLLIGSHEWDRRIYLLDSLLNTSSCLHAPNDNASLLGSEDSDSYLKEGSLHLGHKDNKLDSLKSLAAITSKRDESIKGDEMCSDEEIAINNISLKCLPSAASLLSYRIGSTLTAHNLMAPTRVYSFDSAQMLQERRRKGLPPSSRLSTLKSFHASGEYRYMVRDPVLNLPRMSSQVSSQEAERFNLSSSASPSFISSKSILPEGARLMVPQNVGIDIAITVYDNEYTSIISYAICTKQYEDWVADKPYGMKSGSHACLINEVNSSPASDLSMWQSFTSLDDYTHYRNYNAKDTLATLGSVFADSKGSHLRIIFDDESLDAVGKVKFSVTCYFAKQFDALRRTYCPSKVDFIRSMSRCRRWSAQGGKSNVYFAKSFDERFIIKQVTRTELKSFEKYAPQYFKYLTDSLSSGSSTCLAKILGIYQVGVQHLKDGKEMKMDLMVMENLFYKRNISKIYDLKGSARSRYNSDTSGTNKVLLDMNLLETLHTNPIFLGSKAKRTLERAVWNDTSFLASIDVMDYSMLVGFDEERKELVFGIIDFIRQYTWDKQLETWVKASGLLGGTKNASPTIISPKQYKTRFRKAMTTYFLTVPDQLYS